MLYLLVKSEILLIAHSSDVDCRFIREFLENTKPIVNGGRFLQIKATYYNPIKRNKTKITMKFNYKLIPAALSEFGKCFKLDVSKEVMPYNTYFNENVKMGAASIQSALDILSDSDKQPLLDNVEIWNRSMDNHMFDLIKYSSVYCKVDCKVLMGGYCFSGLGVRAYRIRCRQLYHNSIIREFAHA